MGLEPTTFSLGSLHTVLTGQYFHSYGDTISPILAQIVSLRLNLHLYSGAEFPSRWLASFSK
jgi:hypothetical protein